MFVLAVGGLASFFGLIIILMGRIGVSKHKEATGTSARIAGAIILASLPMALLTEVALTPLRGNIAGNTAVSAVAFAPIGTVMLCVFAGMVYGIIKAEPK